MNSTETKKEAGDAPDSREPFPARVHVILAREAPIGIVIRRGPSKRVCTLLWDRTNDTFTVGQWLKGRIYERRSDLSPDGKYFLYFAMNGKGFGESGGSWTATSRTPYLKAIAFFPKGDCWQGGGLFVKNRTYWLNGIHEAGRDNTNLRRDETYTAPAGYGSECLGVYYPRLIRDGWILRGTRDLSPANATVFDHRVATIFDKDAGHGWTLRKIAHSEINREPGRGCYWDEHEIRHVSGAPPASPRPDWEWADVDGDRLIWAEKGILYAADMHPSGPAAARPLTDLNDYEFEPIVAPY